MSKYFSKPLIIPSLLSIIVISVSCLLISQLFLHDCLWDCAPKRNFSELDLNLPSSLFPKGAEIYNLNYIRDDTGRDPAVASSTWNGGRSTYSVLKSATNSQAAEKYRFNIKQNFFTKPIDNVEKYSSMLDYNSKVADESIVRCGYFVNDLRCNFSAQYEEFNIDFTTSIGDEKMTSEDFLNVVRYIDARMAILLNKSDQ